MNECSTYIDIHMTIPISSDRTDFERIILPGPKPAWFVVGWTDRIRPLLDPFLDHLLVSIQQNTALAQVAKTKMRSSRSEDSTWYDKGNWRKAHLFEVALRC